MTSNERPWYEEGAELVTVTMTVTFDAYVRTDLGGERNERAWRDRLVGEVEDAIEYRAVHAEETEGTDALVALVGGGSGDCVETIKFEAIKRGPADPDAVRDAVANTEAWR